MSGELVDLDSVCAFYLKREDEDSKENPIALWRKEREESLRVLEETLKLCGKCQEERKARDARIKEKANALSKLIDAERDYYECLFDEIAAKERESYEQMKCVSVKVVPRDRLNIFLKKLSKEIKSLLLGGE